LVARLRPKFFLIENVPGLLRGHHRWALETIRRRSAAAGYHLAPPVLLNARDFGVPQNRQRVFLLGRRREIQLPQSWPPAPTHFAPDSPEVALRGSYSTDRFPRRTRTTATCVPGRRWPRFLLAPPETVVAGMSRVGRLPATNLIMGIATSMAASTVRSPAPR
jgi:site-specific DNA-cytosine methylase